MQGMSEEDIQKTAQDPAQAPLDDKDRAMLIFVMSAIKTPNAVIQADVDSLHSLGWEDGDILDAMSHVTSMIGASIMMKTFKMDITC
jgi:alkylhydroperoxidase family enzyme